MIPTVVCQQFKLGETVTSLINYPLSMQDVSVYMTQ